MITQEEAFQQYLDSYKQLCPEIRTEELDFLRQDLTLRTIKKKDFFLSQDQVQKEMAFVVSGLLRSYYIDAQGKKITIGFIAENAYAADYPSFIQQLPSKYFIEALEEALIVCLPYTSIQNAYKKFKNFELYGRRVAEQILIAKQERLESFQFENGVERYVRFIENNREIMSRISVSHLASYLGLERQTLTRIRKQLLEEKK